MFDVPRIKRCETKPYSFESLNPDKPFILHTRPLAQTRNELVLRFSLRDSDSTKAVDESQEKLRLAREALTKGKTDEAQIALALALRAAEVALDHRAMECAAHCCVQRWENVTETKEIEEDGALVRRSVAVDCTPENVLRFLRFMYASTDEQGAGRADDIKSYLHWASIEATFSELLKDGDALGKA
jgi:hypothetical protein